MVRSRGTGRAVRKRPHFRVVCPLVLAACLGPGAVRESAAQTGTQMDRELAQDCARLDIRACSQQFRGWWEGFKKFTATAVVGPGDALVTDAFVNQPLPSPRFIRDGMFVHVNAPTFSRLKGIVAPDLKPTGCAQLQVNAADLARLMCRAQKELSPFERNAWADEQNQLSELRGRLASAMCLPSSPQDACAIPVRVAETGPDESREPLDLVLAQQQFPQVREDLL